VVLAQALLQLLPHSILQAATAAIASRQTLLLVLLLLLLPRRCISLLPCVRASCTGLLQLQRVVLQLHERLTLYLRRTWRCVCQAPRIELLLC
jgi:hypothetical protein